MQNTIDWDDIRLFLHVARMGTLSRAAQSSGTSAATLNRRIARFEEALGEPIFERSQTGYELTPAGEHLVALCARVEEGVLDIQKWREGQGVERVVRISAGAWTSQFLSQNIQYLRTDSDQFRIEFVTAYSKVDIGRHNADIGLRSVRPSEPKLVAKRLINVAYGLYCQRSTKHSIAQLDAVAISGEGANIRSSRWFAAKYGAQIKVRGNDARSVLDLVLAGAGFSIFPCFIGDAHEQLRRIDSPIAELNSEQWLVCHSEVRHVPEVRLVIDRIGALVSNQTRLFGGQA